MTMEAAVKEVESQLRIAANTPEGEMAIRKVHVNKVLHSQKAKKTLGRKRADVVWCCVARLLDSGAHINKDMHLSEENKAMLRAKGEAALGTGPQALADKLEMTGSVYTWLTENEETNKQGVFVIRPGKLTQLKNARKDGARSKGGHNAIMAALVLLGAQGEATLMMDPNSPRRKGTWEKWIGDTVEWMVTSRWITMDQAPRILELATETNIVVEVLARQPTWVKWRIDRCAFGRLEQKPTIILTNIGGWRPTGSTGNGRCKGGKCTGTVTASGRTAHLKQTVANSKEKRVDNGKKTGGRYEWTTKAVVNALEEGLLREIIQAL